MMKTVAFLVLAALGSGCASYRWTSSVPENLRTVRVPSFRNLSKLTETGPVVTRQVLREFRREGTFRILDDGAALEIQGEITSAEANGGLANYRTGSRYHGGELVVTAKVSVIDKVNGRVLIDNRKYTGEAPFSAGQDNNTALRDACGRAADALAQRIVDDVLAINFKSAKKDK